MEQRPEEDWLVRQSRKSYEEPLGEQEHVPLPEAHRINAGVAQALCDGTVIEDEIAWWIAREFDPGSGALHDFVMTGEVSVEIWAELEEAYMTRDFMAEMREAVQVQDWYLSTCELWLAALDGYLRERMVNKGPVVGWPEGTVNTFV